MKKLKRKTFSPPERPPGGDRGDDEAGTLANAQLGAVQEGPADIQGGGPSGSAGPGGDSATTPTLAPGSHNGPNLNGNQAVQNDPTAVPIVLGSAEPTAHNITPAPNGSGTPTTGGGRTLPTAEAIAPMVTEAGQPIVTNGDGQNINSGGPTAGTDVPEANAAAAQGPSPTIIVPSVPDLFDPNRLRLNQDFAAMVGVEKPLTTVPIRKPAKEWWFQTHPDEGYRIETAILELKEDREIYIVDRALWDALSSEPTFGTRALITTITKQGVLFVWPIRLPGIDGKLDDWNRSALEAAAMAEGRWTRMAANMHLGAYDIFRATANWPAPEWPKHSFRDILATAFKDRIIDSLDHVVLKRLRGEA